MRLRMSYDYLVKRDKVSSQDLKMIRQRKLSWEGLQELQTGGYSVKTTIDNAVYNAMQDVMSQYMVTPRPRWQ